MGLLKKTAFAKPRWAEHLSAPTHKINLGHLPTPLHAWDRMPLLDQLGVSWYIKRDDASAAIEMAGNKVRKLEFLLADALEQNCDCVVTIGGAQSNHCRATAAAARLLGLEPHLILRAPAAALPESGLEGNLMLDRMLDATIHVVSTSEYVQVGHAALVERLGKQLEAEGKRPYLIPVGGSNALGVWGYISGLEELRGQLAELEAEEEAGSIDHIVFACGSSGTAAGIAYGARLSGLSARIHAVCVCDTPDYFYQKIEEDVTPIGANLLRDGRSRDWLEVHQGRGIGYAKATQEELQMAADVAAATGVLIDPVYSGKALFHFCSEARRRPEEFRGKRILFWHTGGQQSWGAYAEQLKPLLRPDQIRRFNVAKYS